MTKFEEHPYGHLVNSHREEPDQIESFVHCSECLDAIPDGFSPREWADLEVGFTQAGEIQVWCKRHNMNVALIHPPMGYQ